MVLDFAESTLENGIKVVTVEMPNIESVAIGVWVGVGGRHEPERLSGVSHFIEHLLFKGTRTRIARDISQAIEGRGGYFNAFTQEESTCYYARIASEHAWGVLEILTDMYLHPRFASEDIDKERGVIMEEITMYRDQPQHLVQEMLGELVWTRHALGRPLVGNERTVGRMTRADILAFKKNKYVSGNTLVAMAGKLKHEECVKRVRGLLGRVRSRKKPAYAEVSKETPQTDVQVLDKPIEQDHLAIGFRLFGRHDRRRYALKLLSILLGENMSSRLFQIVREKHGLAYSIHSSAQLYEETGVMDVQAGIEAGRSSRALDLILGELARLKERKVSSRELRRAKDYAIGQLRIGLESTSNRMMWVGENMLCYDRPIQPEEIVSCLEKVTEKDILAVARNVLDETNMSIALIAPDASEKEADTLRRKRNILA